MFWDKKLPLLAIATPTVRDLWVAICIGEWQQMSVLLKKWPKSDGYCCLPRTLLSLFFFLFTIDLHKTVHMGLYILFLQCIKAKYRPKLLHITES